MADSGYFIDQRESDSSDEDDFREEFAGSTIAGYRFEPVVLSSEEDSASDIDSDDSGASLAGKLVETLDRTQTRDWCKCGECCTMDTDVECVSCREIDTVHDITDSVGKTCVTGHPKFQTVCLDRDVLSVAAITFSYMNRTKLSNPISDIVPVMIGYSDVRVPQMPFPTGTNCLFRDRHEGRKKHDEKMESWASETVCKLNTQDDELDMFMKKYTKCVNICARHVKNIDNEERVERGNPGYNPLFKLQKLLDITDPQYERYFRPGKNLSVDESMIKFKGRIFFRQYMPAKPTKWGIKNFVLCDAKTGYTLRRKIYTGKSSFARDPEIILGEQVVLSLMDGYSNKGHVVYMDNYYSNPVLYQKLEQSDIGACWTVNPLRKKMPEGVKPRNLALRKGDDPVLYRSRHLVACAWQDTKRVTFISTVDTNNTIDKSIHSRDAPDGRRLVEKPVLAEQYNHNMGAVDLYDQLMGTYAYPHKVQKWYTSIYHNLIETALVNGYIVSREENEKLKNAISFRKEVIDGLLENFERASIQKCTAIPNEYIRLKERHFIKKYDNKQYKPDCKVCASMRPRVRRQTSYYCHDCGVPLCTVPCFELFHTYKDFKRARENIQ